MYRVNVQVVNLKSNQSCCNKKLKKDPYQESQLLYNEVVKVVDLQGDWALVEAVEQKKRQPTGEFKGYQGWLPKIGLVENKNLISNKVFITSHWAEIHRNNRVSLMVSFGTSLELKKKEGDKVHVLLADDTEGWTSQMNVKCSSIIDDSEKFLGFPYLWGGRSAFSKSFQDCLTSVDCSGFTNLLYRVRGINIPRNANDQYAFCQKITAKQLQPGDLVFSSPVKDPEKIDHVMLYIGGDKIIEARMSSGDVSKDTLSNRFGKSVKELNDQDATSGGFLYYGAIPSI
ncbi:MAG: C40 family peptidase [Chlamydiota bacterium]|nr:C40 family peptidase [Chlamydiota bacterium]